MKIVWYPAITLDGYIASKDGDSNWVKQSDEKIFIQEAQNTGCVIVGRTTYEQYNETIYPIKGTKTYVVTTNPEQFTSTDAVKYISADADLICEIIGADGFTSALLSGGGETNGLFAAASKIDTVIMSIYPIMLGEGVRMLGSYMGSLELALKSFELIEDGVVQNRYEVVK
jgi:dihydrofolate reductase